jgi:hypothetical protein
MTPTNYQELGQVIRELNQHLHGIDITLAKLEKEVATHIRRTEINEDRLNVFEKELSSTKEDSIKFKAWLAMSGWIAATAIAVSEIFIK